MLPVLLFTHFTDKETEAKKDDLLKVIYLVSDRVMSLKFVF